MQSRAARRGHRSLVASLALSLGAGTVVGAGAVSAPTEAVAAPVTYTVKSGDSWWSISRQYGMSMHDLAALNGKTINSTLYVGDVVKVGDSGGSTPAPAPSTGTYTVRSGDSWWRIAHNHGMSMYDLAALNGKTVNSPLYVGDVLKVSGSSSTPAPTPTPAPSSKTAAVNHMIAKVNNPNTYYSWGGNGPYGYDCSGLVREAMAKSGYSLMRTSHDQYVNAKSYVSKANAQPGDLFFWRNSSTGRIYHVAMYIGDGKMAHALNPTRGLMITSVDYMPANMLSVAGRY